MGSLLTVNVLKLVLKFRKMVSLDGSALRSKLVERCIIIGIISPVGETADTPDLGSGAERHGGSSPSPGTGNSS